MAFIILSLQTNDDQIINEDFSNLKHGVVKRSTAILLHPMRKHWKFLEEEMAEMDYQVLVE